MSDWPVALWVLVAVAVWGAAVCWLLWVIAYRLWSIGGRLGWLQNEIEKVARETEGLMETAAMLDRAIPIIVAELEQLNQARPVTFKEKGHGPRS